jgi:hypothetical protein
MNTIHSDVVAEPKHQRNSPIGPKPVKYAIEFMLLIFSYRAIINNTFERQKYHISSLS